MAYLNHQRARLGPPAWSMMEMAAVWQYSRHSTDPVRGDARDARTRLEVFTGTTWDASLALGYAGQGG